MQSSEPNSKFIIPLKEAANEESGDSGLAETAQGTRKRNLGDEVDVPKSKRTCKTKSGKGRSKPKRMCKTKSSGKRRSKKAEWKHRNLLTRYAVAGDEVGVFLTQTKPLYNRDIGEQLAECFLRENGSRGINPSSQGIDEDIGLPVNSEQDMSDVVRYFTSRLQESVRMFVAVVTDPLHMPNHSRCDTSLVKQWNIVLDAEKWKYRASA
jgi:hypothetical protein